MAKGTKKAQGAAVSNAGPSSESSNQAVEDESNLEPKLKHQIPTEEEVRRALEGNDEAEAQQRHQHKKKKHGILYYLTMVFGLLAAALLFQLIRDDQFLRKRAPAVMKRLPWQHAGLDRIFALACAFVGYLVAAIIVDRRGLLRTCRRSWRSQRREFIGAYKEAWKHRRTIAFQYLLLLSTVAAAAVVWRMVIAYTSCDAPIVVVLSGSMETAFYRGDLLFLTNDQTDPIIPGEIVVFKIEGRDIPIVHRVMQSHLHDDGTYSYLTKGDNNQGNDRSLYAPGQVWLERKHIVGRARFFLPYIGMITVKLNEYPLLKMGVIVGMIGMMIWSREL